MKNTSTLSLIVLLILGSLAWSLLVYMSTPADMLAILLGHDAVHELSTD